MGIELEHADRIRLTVLRQLGAKNLRALKATVVVECNGKPLAALVPYEKWLAWHLFEQATQGR